MSLQTRITTAFQAVGADIKKLTPVVTTLDPTINAVTTMYASKLELDAAVATLADGRYGIYQDESRAGETFTAYTVAGGVVTHSADKSIYNALSSTDILEVYTPIWTDNTLYINADTLTIEFKEIEIKNLKGNCNVSIIAPFDPFRDAGKLRNTTFGAGNEIVLSNSCYYQDAVITTINTDGGKRTIIISSTNPLRSYTTGLRGGEINSYGEPIGIILTTVEYASVASGRDWFYGALLPDNIAPDYVTSAPVADTRNGDFYLKSTGDVFHLEENVWVWLANIKGAAAAVTMSALVIDFGTTPISDKKFTVSGVTAADNSKVILVLEYSDTADNKADEAIAANMQLSASRVNAGTFDIHAFSHTELLRGKFNINYMIGA